MSNNVKKKKEKKRETLLQHNEKERKLEGYATQLNNSKYGFFW
jgi:hypothetical protein